MNHGFHNSAVGLAANVRPEAACAQKNSTLSDAGEAIAAVGVPQPKELPGRFPGAEPYVAATCYRGRQP